MTTEQPNQPQDSVNTQNNEEQSQAAEQKFEEMPQIDYLAEIQKYKDNWMREAAEAQNIKRRAEQDLLKVKFYSIEKFAKDLIGVTESLFRASEAISDEMAASSELLKNAKDGIEITKKEMLNVLERHHVVRIDPKGEKFDPSRHEAIAQLESELDQGIIIDVARAGYILKDRLLQAALVAVSKGK